MASQLEDQRAAANIYASLSSYVITASLGVIAAQAALAVFVLDKRDHLFWFYTWMIAGVLASVLSIALGGKGIAAIASAGFDGAWTLKPKKDYFNYQAISCLMGILFLLFSLFSGTTKAENPQAMEEIHRLNTSVESLRKDLSSLQAQYAALSDAIKSSSNCPTMCPQPAQQKPSVRPRQGSKNGAAH
jgi:hypothetical protein